MPYTLGTVHALVGTGEIAVSHPAALLLHVIDRPDYLGSKPGTPVQLFGLGRIAPGTAAGFFGSVELEHQDQLVAQLADGVTRIGFSLGADVSMSLTELLETGASAQLFGRNPKPIYAASQADINSHGSVLRLSYSVPAGRRAIVGSAWSQWSPSTGGAADGWASFWFWFIPAVGGQNYVGMNNVYRFSDAPAQPLVMPMGLWMGPGDTIQGYSSSTSLNWWRLACGLSATEFDA